MLDAVSVRTFRHDHGHKKNGTVETSPIKECFLDSPVPFSHSTLISLDFEFSKTRNLPTVSSINERRVSKKNKNMLKARFRPRAVSSVRLAEA